ncbi:hypothetical protein BCR34DRAFT_343823 [Clohesyomyces aquaticus]|uniref:Uncharacterized protein n=1 Tax=Clohesyomyces aquaticus TaxID=1231657 RepID=A0A1Y1ZKA0_9PLEO|nr:hypothetical protein BCR34DRAFT_343823 [Clohesyomyces aquaticus]
MCSVSPHYGLDPAAIYSDRNMNHKPGSLSDHFGNRKSNPQPATLATCCDFPAAHCVGQFHKVPKQRQRQDLHSCTSRYFELNNIPKPEGYEKEQ